MLNAKTTRVNSNRLRTSCERSSKPNYLLVKKLLFNFNFCSYLFELLLYVLGISF